MMYYFSQLYDREEELEELQGELEESKEREKRREGEEGAEVEQLRVTLSLDAVERETMELKLASQEELIADLRLEVRKQQTF